MNNVLVEQPDNLKIKISIDILSSTVVGAKTP